MAVKTYTEQLEEVQTAISKIVTKGQSYTIDGRQMNRADLKELYAQEQRLRILAARESRGSGGGIPVYGVTPKV